MRAWAVCLVMLAHTLIDRGERVTITSRGQVRAVLMRCEETRARAHAERNPAFGLWADRQGTVDDDVRRLRQPRVLP